MSETIYRITTSGGFAFSDSPAALSELEAARAYDRAAVEMHGEFARVNFPAIRSALMRGER